MRHIPVQVALGLLIFGGTIALGLNSTYIIGQLKAGSAAPWSEQWALVQRSVEQYPGAVLTHSDSSREYNAPASYDAALKTYFSFDQADGTDILVTLSDTNPEGSIHVSTYKDSSNLPSYTQEELTNLKPLLEHIKVSPRDALNAAIARFGADLPAPEKSIGPSISLRLSERNSSSSLDVDKLNIPAVWRIDLYVEGKDPVVWVDAETGRVLLVEQFK